MGNTGLAPGMKPPCGGSAARSPHFGSCRRTALQACTLQQNGASCCQGICWAHVHQKYPSSPRYHAALCFNTAISAGCRRLQCDASAGLCAAAKRGELVQLCLRDSRASMTPSSPQQRGPLCLIQCHLLRLSRLQEDGPARLGTAANWGELVQQASMGSCVSEVTSSPQD